MIKAVLFDMDGVLVDTEWFYNRRRVAYLETQGFTFDEIPDLSGTNDVYIWEYFIPDDPVRREEIKRGYSAYQLEHPVPYTELLNMQAKPVIEELHRRGIRTAIASSGYVDLIQELVDIAGIGDALDVQLSCHECSAFKPDPEVYLRAMDMLGVTPAESLIIEDSPIGIEAGHRAGARVFALRPHEGVMLDQSGADRIIDSLADILNEVADTE